MRCRLRRCVVLAVGAGATLLLTAPAAWAHVTVASSDATQGGFAVLSFLVPTESPDASTTKVTVALPTDHPIPVVSVQPHPGWSYTVHRSRLAKPVESDDGKIREVVDRIVWTADNAASAIKPGEFDQFTVSAGPLPHVASLTFRTVQGYSDGTVVRWVEVPAPGSTSEPQHPAPVLTLAAGGSGQEAGPTTVTSTRAAEGSDDDGTDWGIVLGAIGIALGAAALVVALRRRATG